MPVSESACRRNSPSFFNAALGGRPAAGAWGALAAVARFLVAYSVIPVAVPAASLPLGPPKSTPNCFVARADEGLRRGGASKDFASGVTQVTEIAVKVSNSSGWNQE